MIGDDGFEICHCISFEELSSPRPSISSCVDIFQLKPSILVRSIFQPICSALIPAIQFSTCNCICLAFNFILHWQPIVQIISALLGILQMCVALGRILQSSMVHCRFMTGGKIWSYIFNSRSILRVSWVGVTLLLRMTDFFLNHN